MKYIKQFENIDWDDWVDEEYPDKPSLYIMIYNNIRNIIYLIENDPSEERNLIIYHNHKFDNIHNNFKKITDQNIINDIINDKIEIRIFGKFPLAGLINENRNKYYSEISKEFNIIF